MSKYLLLLLIPFVDASISIQIAAGDTERDTSVKFTGSNIDIISDQERETFQIGDQALKEACRIFSGVTPTDVYVKSPTPWEDVYNNLKWNQVQRILKPVNARVLNIHMEPVMISTREFVNDSPVKAKYNTAISQEIEETVSNKWTAGGALTVGKAISYNILCAAGNEGGSSRLSYEESWGNETTRSKSDKLGTTTSVEVELNPGQAVVATLTATHGTINVEVDYEAELTGIVFANYLQNFRGHHYWGYPIEYLLQFAGLPTVVRSSENIAIGFYSSAKVEVKEKDTSQSIMVVPAGFIPITNFRGDQYD